MNTSHAEKIKKFSEDSEHNFEGGASSQLDKNTDRSNLKIVRLNVQPSVVDFYWVQLL